MFVDTLNAPPDAIGGTVLRVAEQLGANIIVTTTDCYVSVAVRNMHRFVNELSWCMRRLHRSQDVAAQQHYPQTCPPALAPLILARHPSHTLRPL